MIPWQVHTPKIDHGPYEMVKDHADQGDTSEGIYEMISLGDFLHECILTFWRDIVMKNCVFMETKES